MDSYYGRSKIPHYYIGAMLGGQRVPREDMTAAQIAEYHAGYEYNQEYGDRKDWGRFHD